MNTNDIILDYASLGFGNFDYKMPWITGYKSLISDRTKMNNIIIKDKIAIIHNNNTGIAKKFKIKTKIDQGTYNTIYLVSDLITKKKYIFRATRPKKYDTYDEDYEIFLYDSFIENFQTVTLYLFAKAKIDIKIMPDIYDIAYDYDYKCFYCVMEYVPTTLLCYNKSHEYNYYNMNIIITKIYAILHALNKYDIKFRHGDLTASNVLITEDYNPLLIDFGLSSFSINEIEFTPPNINDYDMLNYRYRYLDTDITLLNNFNIIHDIILLLNTMNYINIKKNSLLNNDFSFILDCRVLTYYFSLFFNDHNKQKNIKLYYASKKSIDLYRDSINGLIPEDIILEMDPKILLDYYDAGNDSDII